MMMATNCWCHPNFQKQKNFLRYGQSLLAAFVNNVYNQGILKLGDTRVELLPKEHQWHYSSTHQRGDAEKGISKSGKRTIVKGKQD